MMTTQDLEFLMQLKHAIAVETKDGKVKNLYHVIGMKTAMLADFSGMTKVEHFTGCTFLTRRAAEEFVKQAPSAGLWEGVQLEVREVPITLSPEVLYLLDVVQRLTSGI